MRYLLALVLLVGIRVFAAIVPGDSTYCEMQTSGPNCNATSNITIHAHDFVVTFVWPSTSTILDNCGGTWVKEATNIGGNGAAVWVAQDAPGGVNCQIRSTISPNSAMYWVAQTYSGVASLGTLVEDQGTGGTMGSASTSLCRQQTVVGSPGDFVVALFKTGFGTNNGALNYQATSGTLRGVAKINASSIAMLDNVATSVAQTVINTITTGINGLCQSLAGVPLVASTTVTPPPVTANYYGSPPLVAGSGITISPSPTQITISAAGTPGTSGMTYINGGVAHIPGTVSIDPDSCATILNTAPATGVVQTDVVSWSMQPSGSGWANGRVYLRPEANAGSIAWRACNSGTTAYTPTARDINWYVARPTP